MKAVILAAGLGSRLRPVTDDVPKCMVAVNGIRIVDKQVDNLAKAGIKEIYVVSGYRHEVLEEHLKRRFPFVRTVANPRYDRTNNMYSLYLASEFVRGREFLLMNGDVYHDASIIEGLSKGAGGRSMIACDRGRYLEESMKITYDGRKVVRIGKQIPEEECYAVSIDIYRISPPDSEALFAEMEYMIGVLKDENSWTEAALDRILGRTRFVPYVIGGRWVEIDSRADLALAEELFANDRLG